MLPLGWLVCSLVTRLLIGITDSGRLLSSCTFGFFFATQWPSVQVSFDTDDAIHQGCRSNVLRLSALLELLSSGSIDFLACTFPLFLNRFAPLYSRTGFHRGRH
ncbi:uncharacterized protein IWZ02DRAFT_261662 [Phyllosticta citriasiana]|uniref:uncharacterized protein n=1 Tax=Phyllosticta citriasiana TaxID=595635 RepID=UPI0030FDE612